MHAVAQASQIGIVGGWVTRWSFGEGLLLRCSLGSLERYGDGSSHVCLHVENIVRLAIECFGPNMFIGRVPNELHIDVQAIRAFAGRCLRECGRPELLRDLAQISRAR